MEFSLDYQNNLKTIYQDNMTFEEQLHKSDGSRFQQLLGSFVAEIKPKVFVEVGTGVSSLFILKGFVDSDNKDAQLYSVDKGHWYPHEIIHRQFNLIKKDSLEALLDLYYQVGPFDMALSDGNHEIKHTTYEYAMLFDCLLPGGYLFADDTSWNNHGSWQKFCALNNLTPNKLGDLEFVQKPLDKPYCPASEIKFRHSTYLEIALAAESNWLAAGGVKHSAFQDDGN